MKSITFTFGRFQPPHWDHTQLILSCCDVASATKSDSLKIYTGSSIDKKRNPLSFDSKVRIMKQLWPYVEISTDPNLRTIFDVIIDLVLKEYTSFNLVIGEDRRSEFETKIVPQVNKLLSIPQSHFSFQIHSTKHKINIHSTTLRDLIKNNQFETFIDLYKKYTTLSEETIADLIFRLSEGIDVQSPSFTLPGLHPYYYGEY